MSEPSRNCFARSIHLTEWELAKLRVLVRGDINDSHVLMVEGRVCSISPDDMASLTTLAGKLK